MIRIAAAFLFFFVVISAAHESAQASVFCPAEIEIVAPWDIASDAPAQNDVSLHYAFSLHGDQPGLLSGHMMLVTDTKAYSVAFDRVQLVRSLDEPGEFYSDAAFLALPAKDAARIRIVRHFPIGFRQ